MKATLPYINKKFDEFNRLMFAGRLPKIPIELCNAKTYLGICRYKSRVGKDGKNEKYDFRLCISTRFDLPEVEIEDTIIHEMIHYYIGVNQMVDTSAHGTLFLQLMNEINQRFDRHLTISHKSTREQSEKLVDTTPRWHVVAIVRFKNGKFGVKVIPRIVERILSYYKAFHASKDVEMLDFYMSSDPYFNRYPNSGALNAILADEREVMAKLQNAHKIECDGTNVKVIQK